MPTESGGYDWPADAAEQAIENYRAFLKQAHAYRKQRAAEEHEEAGGQGHGPAPDPVTDVVWHTHILFTEKYHQDCKDLFGEYLHHRPAIADE